MATSSGTASVALPSDTQILITREFDAPARLVYRAYTEPELIRRWWAGHRGTVTSVEIDVRPGGRWRYVMTAHAGFEVGFHGEFSEVLPAERLVTTEVFEGMPDAFSVCTTTFTEKDGRTVLETLVQHANRQHRDLHIDSGMEGGMQEAYDLLEQIAATLPAQRS